MSTYCHACWLQVGAGHGGVKSGGVSGGGRRQSGRHVLSCLTSAGLARPLAAGQCQTAQDKALQRVEAPSRVAGGPAAAAAVCKYTKGRRHASHTGGKGGSSAQAGRHLPPRRTHRHMGASHLLSTLHCCCCFTDQCELITSRCRGVHVQAAMHEMYHWRRAVRARIGWGLSVRSKGSM